MENLAKMDSIDQIDPTIVDSLTSKKGKRSLSGNTKKSYKATVNQYNDFLSLNDFDVNQDSLQFFFDSIQEEYAGTTLNQKKYALQKSLKAFFGADSIARNIAIDKAFEQIDTYKIDQKITKDNYITEDTILELLSKATQKTGLLIQFLFVTGCRVSEMINIKLSDCKQNSHVKIRIRGKGKKERFVYIALKLYDRIREIYDGGTFLFETSGGNKLHRRNVSKQIHSVGKKLGLDISSHTLRHSRATNLLLSKEYTLKSVSNYLGHAGTAITSDMYIHDSIDPDDMLEKDKF